MLFRLRTPHVIEGAVRNPGTIVGPYGSNAPVIYDGDPTPDMEGADDEGTGKVREVFRRLYNQDPPWSPDERRHDRREDRRARKPDGELRAYAGDDHSDNQKVDEEAQKKAAETMAEANAKFANKLGTTPSQTIPAPGHATMVRPMSADTPQEGAIPVTRPLAQQLPDAQGGATATPKETEHHAQTHPARQPEKK